jgi:hypothetical protein
MRRASTRHSSGSSPPLFPHFPAAQWAAVFDSVFCPQPGCPHCRYLRLCGSQTIEWTPIVLPPGGNDHEMGAKLHSPSLSPRRVGGRAPIMPSGTRMRWRGLRTTRPASRMACSWYAQLDARAVINRDGRPCTFREAAIASDTQSSAEAQLCEQSPDPYPACPMPDCR